MKLTVLTDNTTRIDAYYLGEPGACYLIETGDRKILFDTGYSDVYARNAAAMGVDLATVDTVVLSHGHNDHTGGLRYLPPSGMHRLLYAHPDVFLPRRWEGESIGSPLDLQAAEAAFDLRLSRESAEVAPGLTFLGQVPRRTAHETPLAIGEILRDGRWQPDYIEDDSALVYRGREGLTIITGCSHSGICNIVEQAKSICGDSRIAGIVGGFHLMKLSRRTAATASYLSALRPGRLCPCHCTCFAARAAIHALTPVEEVCVGDVLEFE